MQCHTRINLSPALKSVYQILCKAQRHNYKSARLKYVLPAPPRVAFRSNKSLNNKLIRSRLKNTNKRAPRNYKCGSKLCQICEIISLENELLICAKVKHIKSILILIATVNL